METELWPNMVAALHKRKILLVIANARLSECRSAKGYAKLGKLCVGCQSHHADWGAE